MAVARESASRTERLYVRLTPDEAGHVAERAAARGLTMSDLIRDAVPTRSDHSRRIGRGAMCAEAALVIRELSAIDANLQKLVGAV
jgi:mobilization protein NikA